MSVTYKTEAYTCPFNSNTYPDILQSYAGCTGGTSALSSFESLPVSPLPTLQTYTFTTDNTTALNPYKLDHPVIYALATVTSTPIPTQTLPDAHSYDFTTNMASASSKPFKYPVYNLGNIASGKTIGIKLALTNADSNAAPISNFTIKLIQTTPTGTEVDLSSQCSNAVSACSIPHAINTTDNYYLAVYDANSADPFVKKYLEWFALEVIDDISASSPNTILKVSDVFRDRVVKYIYINPAQATTFTLAPVAGGNTTNRDLELYAMSGSNNIFPVGAA